MDSILQDVVSPVDVILKGTEARKNELECFYAFLVICVAAIIMFVSEGHMGLDLADEGFLWYGAQRTLLGELPVRDFMAYDIGRYFWVAAFMKVLGDDGIICLRLALLSAVPVCLLLSFLFLKRAGYSWGVVGLSVIGVSLLFLIAVFSTHMLDSSIALLLVASIAYLIYQPNLRSFYVNGLVLGLAAMVGKNHGLYGGVGFAFSLAYLAFYVRIQWKWLFAWLSGLFLGCLPMILLGLLAPGFASAVWDNIHLILFELKDTNFAIKIPAPMDAFAADFPLLYKMHLFLLGVGFLALPAFNILGLIALGAGALKRQRFRQPILAASIFLSIPYTHYAFSRSDSGHFVLGALPFLIGLFGLISLLPSRNGKVILLTAVALMCVVFALPLHPRGFQSFHPGWKEVTLNNECVTLTSEDAEKINNRLSFVEKYCTNGGVFLAEPDMAGLYAVFRQRSPVWEIYALFKRFDQFQQEEVQKLVHADPKLILWHDFAVDGVESRRFSSSHPFLVDFINKNYHRIASPERESDLKAFVK